MDSLQPPKELWEDGPNTSVLEVRVHQDTDGRIWSVHQFKSATEEQKPRHWPGGGVRQLAYAFLTEALRREAFASIMVEMSKDNGFLKNFKEADAEKKTMMVAKLSLSSQAVLSNSSLKMGDGVAREILEMLSSQV